MNEYTNIPSPENIDPFAGELGSMMVSPTNKPNIKKFMRDFNNKHRDTFNNEWFVRNDDDIIEGMEKIILSAQRTGIFDLIVQGFTVIKDIGEIRRELREYYAKKLKNKKDINEYDYINLKDSAVMLLKVKYLIRINLPDDKIHINGKTKEPEPKFGIEESLIVLPRYVNKYYFRIKGNMYSPSFQIVDGSTYNNATSSSKTQSVVLKTQFMPINVYKEYNDILDLSSNESKRCVHYTSYIFTKKSTVCKFILARYGLYGAIEFLGLNGIYVRKPSDPLLNPDVFYNFTDEQNKIVVAVYKSVYDKDNVTQSFVCTILRSNKRLDSTDFDYIYDTRFWLKVLGADYMSPTLDKGLSVLDSFEFIYDIKTRECIRLPEEEKDNTYKVLRWIIREFSFLRAKDNLDISTKRPRMADEYLASVYASAKLSKGIYALCDKGKKITYSDIIKRVVGIDPMSILNNINTTNLVDYVDLVNDNDAELALSYSYKGISGIGDNSSSSVPNIYRTVHPSHLGRVDLDASSASDPGLSGILCPMGKLYDGSFSDFKEPNGWKEWYSGVLENFYKETGFKEAVTLGEKVKNYYEDAKEEITKETIECYRRIVPAMFDIEGKIDYSSKAKVPKVVINKDTMVTREGDKSEKIAEELETENDEDKEVTLTSLNSLVFDKIFSENEDL